mmetsp:Transcript_11337/g.26637  ORF Transcript_11337/g.26637 Transcript_11337/m.26637 type:complete len:221 (+) Transcript_11337:178-840(+)
MALFGWPFQGSPCPSPCYFLLFLGLGEGRLPIADLGRGLFKRGGPGPGSETALGMKVHRSASRMRLPALGLIPPLRGSAAPSTGASLRLDSRACARRVFALACSCFSAASLSAWSFRAARSNRRSSLALLWASFFWAAPNSATSFASRASLSSASCAAKILVPIFCLSAAWRAATFTLEDSPNKFSRWSEVGLSFVCPAFIGPVEETSYWKVEFGSNSPV